MKDDHVNLWQLAATLTVIFVASAHADMARPERVQVVTDQQRGEVRFVIDGQPVLRVTSQSIIVSGSVIYTGVINDIGNGN